MGSVVEPPDLKVAYRLTVLAAMAMAVVSAVGAFWTGWLYRDNPLIDLVFIVPPMLIGAIALVRRQSIGWVLAVVMSISGTVYTLSLAIASIAVTGSGQGSGEELPVWITLTVLGAITAGTLLGSMRPAEAKPRMPA